MDTYEKKYKEAHKKARMYCDNAKAVGDYAAVARYENIFPELRESEDERIRKELIETINCIASDCQYAIFLSQEQKQRYLAYLEKQKEQKPDIELIQRSWYMEGYYDREFGKEPKWIIKTGEGGPKHELNPKYGQPLAKEQKPAEWSEEDYHWEGLVQLLRDYQKTIDRNSNNMTYEDVERYICWVNSLRPQPKQEWSEKDEKMIERLITRLNWITYNTRTDGTSPNITFFDEIEWLKSLRPKPDQDPNTMKRNMALSFGHYLDKHRPDGKMCLSNGEWEDLGKAFVDLDWGKIIRYANKYQPHWKPSEEQMNALNFAITYMFSTKANPTVLRDLYNDLLKLTDYEHD